MGFLIKQIPSLGLLVKVVWLGPNADKVVRQLMNDETRRKAGRSVMFFAWRPSTITESGRFLSMSFPQCETMSTAYSGKCPRASFTTHLNTVITRQLLNKVRVITYNVKGVSLDIRAASNCHPFINVMTCSVTFETGCVSQYMLMMFFN